MPDITLDHDEAAQLRSLLKGISDGFVSHNADSITHWIDKLNAGGELPKPTPMYNPDWSAVGNAVDGVLNRAVEAGWLDRENLTASLFEMVMETIYGHDFWKWFNAQGW